MTDNEINIIIDSILLKTGILIEYPIKIKCLTSGNSNGYFIDKTIYINANLLIDDINQIERIVFHEFLHIYLQVETKDFYNVLIKKYYSLYLFYLNKFVASYQLIWPWIDVDIMCIFKQSNDIGYENQTRLENEHGLSPNYNQFKQLSEFIIHNVDNYYYGLNSKTLNKDIKDMVQFVMSLINKKPTCNFCKEKESVGVYATDHGPFSLAYCEKCLNHDNIRTIGNALSKYARYGDKAFGEYNEISEPNVYFKGKYILLRELIKIITVDDVERIFPKEHGLYSLIIDKITNKTI